MLNPGPRRLGGLLAVVAVSAGVAACGSGGSSGSGGAGAAASGNPQTLLKQTFAANHSVKSGVLKLSVSIVPAGSSLITAPLTFSLDGPFQSRGAGKTPESSFTLAFSGLGRHGSFGVTTTGSGAYISLEGKSYQLPKADFAKLQKSLGSSSTGAAPGFSSLGVDPETWLSQPKIVGTATVDGVTTEHLHATVDVRAVIASVNKLLGRESSTIKAQAGVTTPRISAATAAKIAAAIRAPSVDVYTGKSDSTLRRMALAASVPITGTTSTQLGGMTSASVRMSLDYLQLGRTQTISAPTNVLSYAQLQSKLEALGSQLQSSLGGGLGTTGSSSTGSGSTGSGSTASSGQVSKYAKCINGAHGDVKKMQRCVTYLKNRG